MMRNLVAATGIVATLAFVGASIAAYFVVENADMGPFGFFLAATFTGVLTGAFCQLTHKDR